MGRVHELFDQVIYILVTRNQSIRDVDCSAVSLNLGSAHFFEFLFELVPGTERPGTEDVVSDQQR